MSFAAITGALVIGALVERVRFGAIMLFSLLWQTVVYAPLAHMIWSSEGLLFRFGAIDFAGGTVVHINSGVAGLVGLAFAGPRIGHLVDTLGKEEMLATAPEELLYRLFHEESVRLFDPRPLAFGCSCTRERVESMLRSLGREEVEAALEAREGEIEVICEFCAQRYTFDRIDAEHLLSHSAMSAPGTAQ